MDPANWSDPMTSLQPWACRQLIHGFNGRHQKRLCPIMLLTLIVAAGAGPKWPEAEQEPLPKGAVARLGTTHLRAIRGAILAFSPSGRYLAGAGAQELYVWDTQTAKLVHNTLLEAREVRAVFFSADGKQLYCHNGNTVQAWNAFDWKALPEVPINPRSEDESITLGRLRGQELVVVRAVKPGSNEVRVCSTRSGETVFEQSIDRRTNDPLLTPDRRHVVVRVHDATLKKWSLGVWDLAKAVLRHSLSVKGDRYPEVTITPDSKRIIAHVDLGPIQQWDLATGESLPPISAEAGLRVVRDGLVISPDSKLLAFVDWDNKVTLYDITASKKQRVLDQRGASALF
jgi:WD40 repeat protein